MIIYRLISPSGKSYIGKTKFTVEKRIKTHVYNWRAKRGRSKLHIAFNKYAPPNISQFCLENRINDESVIVSWRSGNWIVQVVCQCSSVEELNKKERELINIYDSISNGYNLCLGGEGGSRVCSNETRKKLSEANRGKRKSLEQRHRMSEARKGYRPSEKTRQKMSESQKGRIISEETKRKRSEIAILLHLNHKIGMYGKQHSNESKQKMSKRHRIN